MIKSIYFLPHGMQIVPGVEDHQIPDFRVLHEYMLQVADEISQDGTSNIILITPHGYNLQDKFTIYMHDNFYGYTYKLKDSVVHGEILEKIEIAGNLEKSVAFLQELKMHNFPVEGLIHGYSGYPMMLNWGEIVPVYYLEQNHKFRYMILGVPRLRHENFGSLRQYLETLASILKNFQDDFILVISGDLAHTHIPEGPYGYHDWAKSFDETFYQWMAEHKQEQMTLMLEQDRKAKACGLAGMYLIHQLLQNNEYMLTTSFYRVPTYFGMGIGRWVHQDG